MNLKQLRFNVKSLDDSAGEGVFSGYASTFGNKDLQGDVIAKGAFAETLEKDYDGGAGIPIHWNHQDGRPTDIIGRTLSAVEDEKGLLISAQLDIEDNPTAQQAYDLLKDGRVHQMSIGFRRRPLGSRKRATARGVAIPNSSRSSFSRSAWCRWPRTSRPRFWP